MKPNSNTAKSNENNHLMLSLRLSTANNEAEIFDAIEKLATLKEKGILTEIEYSAKKAELLSRL